MRIARHSHGFSMVELVLVLSIIGVMAAIALPRYSRSLTRYRVELAAHRIINDLDYARSHARQTSQSVRVRFKDFQDRVQIAALPGLKPNTTYESLLSEDPYRVAINLPNFGGDGDVIFDGYGKPDTGGTVVVQAGALSMTVTLDAETGKASVP